MNTLYCFKLVDDSNALSIVKYEITDWRINTYGRQLRYVFPSRYVGQKAKNCSVPKDKLDRFVSDKVYTFNPSQEAAEKIIRDSLVQKVTSLRTQLFSQSVLLDRFENISQSTFLCPLGCTDCVLDPMYIFKHHPEWYKSMHGDKTPQEVVKETCMEYIKEWGDGRCHEYDDEDK